MNVLFGLLLPLHYGHLFVHRWAKRVAITAMGLMVTVILLQVFCRYILNSALPWPDEAARFLMLWMTGLMAPISYRAGGFVAIDTLSSALPKSIANLLSLVLLCLAGLVLLAGVKLGWDHSRSGLLFDSSSLKIPLDWFGFSVIRIKLVWMYASLLVGMLLLFTVNLELILRSLIALIYPQTTLPTIPVIETDYRSTKQEMPS